MTSVSPPLLARGSLLADRYRIVQHLGDGGMGRVYEAHDGRLDETVALKTITFTEDPSHLERFQREVRLARRITHPNIARTHDIGESDGLHFLTMELIGGQSLDQLIDIGMAHAGERQGPFSADEVATIGAALAKGLDAAHEADVIHRDLKPANVMVEQRGVSFGRVVITDFGVARLAGGLATSADAIMGTPVYMAPEQILGEDTTPASDLYALGVLIFEMLTGELPFEGTSPMAVAVARCHQLPRDPRSFVDMPAPLAELVLRCLEQDPQQRPKRARDIANALDRMLRSSRAPTEALPASLSRSAATPASGAISTPFVPITLGQHTLAVLPFQFRGPTDLNYLGDTLAQELIDAVSRTKGLRVLGFGATRTAGSDPGPDSGAIGRAVGATVVLSADVHATTDQIRVSARLLDVTTGVQIWSEQFDKTFENIFELKDTLSKRIANTLRVELTFLAHRPKANAETIRLYLLGRKYLDAGPSGRGTEAVELFDRCIEGSPGFAPAYAYRAYASIIAWWGDIMASASATWRDDCERYVSEALEHAGELAESHLSAAMFALQLGRLRTTARELANALTIAPTLPAAHRYLADLQCEAGRLKEGYRRAKLALELDPSMRSAHNTIARHHALTGNWDACWAELQLMRDVIGTHDTGVLTMRVRMAVWCGDLERVTEDVQHLNDSAQPIERMMANFVSYVTTDEDDRLVGPAMGWARNFGNARIESLVGQLITEAYAARGETDKALAVLTSIADTALVDVAWLERCPLLEELRSTREVRHALGIVRSRANAVWDI